VAIVQTDDALIRATRTGDAEAFGEITRRHVGRVYTMCLRMTGEPGTAEALTESVFLSAYTEAALLQAPIQSWLLQRAVAACEDPQESSPPDSEGEGEPDTETEDEVQDQQLQAILDGLSPSFRASIILPDVLELDYDQAADIMNLPTGTARSRVHRARLDMASALTQISRSKSKSKSKAD
jgi:RNA polymerase sigma-70 factor (ECF subfamily)